MNLTLEQVARMIDLSAVRAEADEAEVRAMVEFGRQFRCTCASTLPCHTPLLISLLAGQSDVHVGGNVAFPSGGATTAIKAAEARDLVGMGCQELDMVLNIGLLRSGHQRRAADDIAGVIEAAGGVPVKVILECHYLTDDEIRLGCDACLEAGADWVKTGTGWAPTGATPQRVALIKSCVGDALGIKAAGGVRDLAAVLDLYRAGARRFGARVESARRILEECAKQRT
jgi:deoxyribose-phosphate aldolase